MDDMKTRDFHEEFKDNERVTRALARASREALRRHKALGVPIAVLKDGEVTLVPPEEIVVPPDPDAPQQSEGT